MGKKEVGARENLKGRKQHLHVVFHFPTASKATATAITPTPAAAAVAETRTFQLQLRVDNHNTVKKLMVEPSATVGLGLHSAAIHGVFPGLRVQTLHP